MGPHAAELMASKLEPPSLRPAKTPSASHTAALRASETFRISAAKTSKSLKKSRAARVKKTSKPDQHQNSALDNAKNEDPAKMTHSIPDFVSCNEV